MSDTNTEPTLSPEDIVEAIRSATMDLCWELAWLVAGRLAGIASVLADGRVRDLRFPCGVIGLAVVDWCRGFRRAAGIRIELPDNLGRRCRRFRI